MTRIRSAARKAGREPSEITLVAVTKGVEIKGLVEAYSGGVRVFGENYVQETRDKINKLKNRQVKWHFIGHLQKNKVKLAIPMYSIIESIDSLTLAEEINKRAASLGVPAIRVMIQVNIAREKTKSGIDAKNVVKLAHAIAGLKNLKLLGLMAIPPQYDDPEMSRPYFITLRRLAERINKEAIPDIFIRDLSIGMSNDFEVAIEEGATIVRVGTAIFGPREEGPKVKAKAKPKAKAKAKPKTKAKAKAKPKTKAKAKAKPKARAKAKAKARKGTKGAKPRSR